MKIHIKENWEKTEGDWREESKLHPERHIPAGHFFSTAKRGPSTYSSRLGVRLTLKAVLSTCQISRYQLAKLLGCYSHYVYRWLNGAARPSALYWQRMAHLCCLQAGGIGVMRLSSINWDTGQIFWRDGGVSQTDHYPPRETRETWIAERKGSKRFRNRSRGTIPMQRVRPFPTSEPF